ncbi:MAG: prepilin-type N-terminal cleavage/methylation domain-containing protein [Gemmatimonadota bacterium]|nr:prepilin-type N-terminal cleavage/methylation domain-containing protein [Gemmatimonadota bacterium]
MESTEMNAQSAKAKRRRRQAGMTMIELLAVLGVMSSLASISIPKYRAIAEGAKRARAIGDLKTIQTTIDTRDSLPADLLSIGVTLVDPWGQPYQYVKFPNGPARVDRFGVQVNSTYDLYSLGADGVSSNSLNAASSFDDLVRANDGGFLALASRY